jgi:hypothetical protein
MRELDLTREKTGDGQRIAIQEKELYTSPIVPNPVEYEDIDNEFCNYFKKNLTIVDEDGKKFETYTFFSSQRFSEFLQTWEHDDNDGNLLMNFFTITRDNNPSWGTLHGGKYNIPGNNRFSVLIRDIVDDNGVDCYEVTSMSQPIQVDMSYRLSLVTAKFKYLNEFNTKINYMFSSKQCYLCINGHYMPMILENIDDDTDYTINGRKFYIQTIDIKLMAYLIPREDLKVELMPKRKKVDVNLDTFNKTQVVMNTSGDEKTFEVIIKFKPHVTNTSFTIDDDAYFTLSDNENANVLSIKVNGDEIGNKTKFKVNSGDEIKLKIRQPIPSKMSKVVFSGVFIDM